METSTIYWIEREFKDHHKFPFKGRYGTREALIKALRKLVRWYNEGNIENVYDIHVYCSKLDNDGVFKYAGHQSIIKNTSVYGLKKLGIID